MKTFLNKDFLLDTPIASRLYHEHAEKMPIIDFHCHLDPKMIAENHQFKDLGELWLDGDHYKWRAMRSNGIEEKYITGKDTTTEEKFMAWAQTVPYTMRNPLYHWTHLELQRVFGIDELLSPTTAKKIFDLCKEKLQQPEFRAQGLIKRFNVKVLCTTDDPIDSLVYHRQIAESDFTTKVLPAWRPDKVMAVEDVVTFNSYIDKLAAVCQQDINTYSDLLNALKKRHDFFNEMGCRLSDHGLADFPEATYTEKEIESTFVKIRSGKKLTKLEIDQYKVAILTELAVMDADAGWTQQFHYGALRNNNSKMMDSIGPDTGFDSIGDWNVAGAMSRFLDNLNSQDKLTKTILYNLNPNANDMIGTMIGNFQDGSIPGKIQFGSGWWFCDQKDGMERQMNTLSRLGLISRFVGMLTDSRSFVSYPRHEYFRRVLCNLFGNDVENGELPSDELPWIGQIIEDISYNNAAHFFKF